MKKISRFIILSAIVILSVFLIICSACDSGRLYGNDTMVDGVYLSCNKSSKKAYAFVCVWDGDKNDMEFTVPDEYCGYKVNRLGAKGVGGFTGNPGSFGINIPDKVEGYDVISGCTSIDDTLTSENNFYLNFTVNIGKYVDTIGKISNESFYACGVKGEEEIIQTYCIVKIYYNVASENSTFYSKDGDIYYKSSGKMIEYRR